MGSSLLLSAAAVLVAAGMFAVLVRGSRPQPEISISRIVKVHEARTLSGVDFRLADLVATDSDKVVFLQVRNASGRPLEFGTERVQLRVGGDWLQPQEVAWLNSERFVAEVDGQSQGEFVAAVVPHNTETVRLFLQYHDISIAEEAHRTKCYRWYTRFPKLVSWVFPKLDRWVIVPLLLPMSDSGWQPLTFEFLVPTDQQVHERSNSKIH